MWLLNYKRWHRHGFLVVILTSGQQDQRGTSKPWQSFHFQRCLKHLLSGQRPVISCRLLKWSWRKRIVTDDVRTLVTHGCSKREIQQWFVLGHLRSGHGSSLHFWFSSGSPRWSQPFPFPTGAGSVQVLSRARVPPPQVLVHSVHSDHNE